MSWLKFVFWNRDQRRLRAFWRLLLQFVCLLAALVGLGGLSLLLPQGPLADKLMRIGPPLMFALAVWVACRILDRRPLSDLGLHINRAWWSDLLFGLGLGAALMTGLCLAAIAFDWVEIVGVSGHGGHTGACSLALILLLLDYVAVGVGEELLFRGYYLRNISEGLHCRWLSPRLALTISALLTAGVFATAHATNPGMTGLGWANTAVAGLLLAIGYVCTGRLALPIGLHITWNFFQGGIFGFPVSGTENQVALLNLDIHGPQRWTGGVYGPEGGLLGTFAFAGGILLTMLWIRARYGSLRPQSSLALYIRHLPPHSPTAREKAGPSSTE